MKKIALACILITMLSSCNNKTEQPYHKTVNVDSIQTLTMASDFLIDNKDLLKGLTDRQIKKLYVKPTICYKQPI